MSTETAKNIDDITKPSEQQSGELDKSHVVEKKKRHWALRLGIKSSKIAFFGTIIVIAILTFASGVINNAGSIIGFKETLAELATPLLGARIGMYVLATFALPRMIFWMSIKSKDEKISAEAKKYERTFQCLIGGMFLVGEIFVVQNLIGALLR